MLMKSNNWWLGRDSDPRSSGYEPDEIDQTSLPSYIAAFEVGCRKPNSLFSMNFHIYILSKIFIKIKQNR